MEPSADQLASQLRDRAFFLRHARQAPRSPGSVLLPVFAGSFFVLFGVLPWYLLVRRFTDGSSLPLDPVQVALAVIPAVGLVACLAGLIVPPLRRRARLRGYYQQFLTGGQVWWQADLGVVLDTDKSPTKTVPGLALIFPPSAPTETAWQQAAEVGQLLAQSADSPLATLTPTLRDPAPNWPADGLATDQAGHHFSRLRPGRHVVVLPDKTVLALHPGWGESLDAVSVVNSALAAPAMPPAAETYLIRKSTWLRLLGLGVCLFILGMAATLTLSFARLQGAHPALRFGAPAFAGLIMVVLLFVISSLFGRTRATTAGLHIATLFHRRFIPWSQVRGFAVHTHAMRQDRERTMSSFNYRYQHQVVAVLQDSRAVALAAADAVTDTRHTPPRVTEWLAILEGYRRAGLGQPADATWPGQL
ncbi:PH domain-containing protein [Buchananella hordeovulneris]|uniref:PH domain-containing protein n=1 Tax=Buchananella hordeovulneris TaxID=52770 RepID=UPI000F5ED878|nr:PH domain-containing protein [Buchananella hordeovulneris]RRD42430.1 hypothetical protein EII13_09600 [Buchananella hordeovulneris]